MILIPAALAGTVEMPGSLVLPTAAPLASGGGQAGVGVLYGFPSADGAPASLSATLRAHVGITDRFAITGGLAAPDTGLTIGLRYNVVQTPNIRLAPWVLGAASADLVTVGAPLADGVGAAFGVALEAGGKSARFDLSVPFAVTGVDPLASPLYAPLTLGSLGATLPLGGRDAIRVGIETLAAPAVTWRHAERRWYLQGTAMYSVVRRRLMLAAEIGLRF